MNKVELAEMLEKGGFRGAGVAFVVFFSEMVVDIAKVINCGGKKVVCDLPIPADVLIVPLLLGGASWGIGLLGWHMGNTIPDIKD